MDKLNYKLAIHVCTTPAEILQIMAALNQRYKSCTLESVKPIKKMTVGQGGK